MLLATNTNETTGNLVFDKTVAMEIDPSASGIILDSLIRIYQNPYVAALREYTSNAMDSHQEAGQTRPIEVSLPTPLAPLLVIEDFGIGMSRNELHKFGQFGFSTKRDDNSNIGGFGLGSKVGLAFSSQYTVQAVKDGKLNMAIIGRDENGNPQMGLMAEEDTDKPNGVKVMIPTSESHKFREALEKNFFVGYPPKSIKIDGQYAPYSVGDPEDFTALKDGLGWRRTKGSEHGIGGIALVHGVRYKIDWNEIASDLEYSIRTGFLNEVVFNLENGSVDIQRSRESLIYSKRTREVLADKLKSMINYATSEFHKEINEAETMREAFQIRGRATSFGFAAEYTWKDKPLTWGLALLDNRKDVSMTVASINYGGSSASGYMANKQVTSFGDVAQWSQDKIVSHAIHSVLVHSTSVPTNVRNRTLHVESNGAVQFATNNDQHPKAGDHTIYFTQQPLNKLPQWFVGGFAQVVSAAEYMEVVTTVRKASASQAAARRKANAVANAPQELEVRLVSLGEGGGSYWVETPVSELDATRKYILLQAGASDFVDKLRRALTTRTGSYDIPGIVDLLIYLRDNHDYSFLFANKTTKVSEYSTLVPNLTSADLLPKIIEGVASKIVKSKSELAKRSVLDRSASVGTWALRFPDRLVSTINSAETREWIAAMNQRDSAKETFLRQVVQIASRLGIDANVAKFSSTVPSPASKYPLLSHVSSYSLNYTDVAEYINLIDAKGVSLS